MPETPDLFAEVANLRDQVDDMARSVSAIARKSGVREDIMEAMDRDQTLARIFLLVDGRRTQGDIVRESAQSGPKVSQASVSRKLESLVQDWDLVRPTSRGKDGIRYVHTSLAKDLRIARLLQKKLKPVKSAAKVTVKKSPRAGG
ncbi:hypothetical protein [Kribbella jiaozuonensis]|uniref:MarR family transcriptional regulator n=1 Tax=Kribbella jiaozuonensis TaxID=2575441 RepID=A0A4U3LX29_9ACTN|nr:hypothetical protein [Kribbella jiaozuonensis]TKK80129.1 hypothetical protein FDA38_17490 [Kribbella jiaozuonensis]